MELDPQTTQILLFTAGGLALAVLLLAVLGYVQRQRLLRLDAEHRDELAKQREKLEAQTQQLRSLNVGLEKMVETRTASAVASKLELDTFLYESSHALRRPLVRIEGLVSLLTEEKDVDQSEMMGLLAETVTDMDRLLRQLLVITEHEHRDVDIEKVELKKLFETLRKEVEHGDVALSMEVEPGTKVFTDPWLFRELLRCLVENAVQYHAEDNPHPNAKLFIKAREPHLIITVEDNGVGIPAAYHNLIFDMFFRGRNRQGGNGLGLYLVKKLTERLHGTVSLQSKEGEGACFTVELPLHEM